MFKGKTNKEETEFEASQDGEQDNKENIVNNEDNVLNKKDDIVNNDVSNDNISDGNDNFEGEVEGEVEVEGERESESTSEILEDNEIILKMVEDFSKLEEEKVEYINRLQRLKADFSNYRKRNDREKIKIQANTTAEIISELLPIIDNFERALLQHENQDEFKKGIEMIYRQMITFLKNQGVEEIEALGKEFDHDFHNAIAQVDSDDYESGIVIEEVQKGYILAEKVVRPAMVKVAQ